jgi:lipopolysaccharide/colanic/teichoic acid biosynthesis glycosyltransferase
MGMWPWSRRRAGRRGLLPAGELGARLEEERLRAERCSLPLSVILCEVGVLEGMLGGRRRLQRFLAGFSAWLGESLRRVDVKGWYDAGRLAVLLPATPEAGGRAVLERLQGWVGSYLEAEGVGARAEGLFELATYPDVLRGQPQVGEQRPAKGPGRARDLFSGGPSLSGAGRWLKRALDVLGSLLLLVLSAPLMLAVAVAVKLSSPGPAVFRQARLGEGGRPFVYYKFRSMYVGNDDRGHRDYCRRLIAGEVASINNGAKGELLLKLAQDPRVTPIGRWLRRSSLDELPQLFNVLKGDMSLVGPRPPIPYEVVHYRDWHLRRLLAAKPGLTGLWQVRSRSSTSFDEMVRMDLRYADGWSLWQDFKIILQTVPAVISAKGAY